jgi:hypothetical protein
MRSPSVIVCRGSADRRCCTLMGRDARTAASRPVDSGSSIRKTFG